MSVTERSTEDEEDEEDEEASSSNDSEGRGAHEAVPPALQRKRKAAGTTMTRKCVISGAVTKVKGKKVTALKPAKSLKPAAPKASGVEAAAEVKKPRKRKASPVLEEPALEELPPRKRTKTAKAADGLLHVCTDEGKTPYSKSLSFTPIAERRLPTLIMETSCSCFALERDIYDQARK